MKRKDRVFDCLNQLSSNVTIEEIKNGYNGFDATYIGENISISRSNTSKELNDLVKEGKVIKITGKPVFYFDKNRISKLLDIQDSNISNTVTSLKDILSISNIGSKKNLKQKSNSEDPFEQIIGCNDSLKIPINQAKAAILYPPSGLNTLLIGSTGVGKSTFAELMYKYAIKSKVIKENAEFITFNCAEYADNPNLLLSQLFGYVKGAFTGAEKDKEGLIDKANGGVLLLDEVHRLPPEGQEMLFIVMDKGLYRRLGETENGRKASILFIFATTEHRDSFLLQTFLRRVPMVIKLPELSERSKVERSNLIKAFFNNEAKIIGMPIRVHKDVLVAFIMYKCKSNIGQLRTDIQLTCAKGYLEYKTGSLNKAYINIDLTCVPEYIYDELSNLKQRKVEELNLIDELYESTSMYIEFLGDEARNPETKDDYRLSDNLYEEINDRYYSFRNLGYNSEEIKAGIIKYVDKYLKNVLSRINFTSSAQHKNELFKVINPKIYYAVETALLETNNKKIYDKKIFIALAMHISSVLENVKNNGYKKPTNINFISINSNIHYKTAVEIHSILQRELEIEIPKEEIPLICIFLNTISEDNTEVIPKIPIIVICHGDSTASSIVNVVNELLETNHCHAINMPLNESVRNVLNATKNMVIEINEGKGVLLLVDMGSLVAFSDIITKDTNIATRSVDMVSTPLALEAARKSLFPEYTLDNLTQDIQQLTPYIGRDIINNMDESIGDINSKVIITTCITGDGAARKIADLLRKSFPFIEKANIKILSMNGEKFKNIRDEINCNNIIAVIGTMDIHLDNVPFIPIDEFIIGDGNRILRDLLIGRYTLRNMDIEANISLIVSSLNEQLTFLNPAKAFSVLSKVFDGVKYYFSEENYIRVKVRFLLHCSFMVERCFRNETFEYKKCDELISQNQQIYDDIITAMEVAKKSFGVNIPKDEVCYLIEFIKSNKI
jgi:transcriptional regulatory protein LevR/transcriptional regulator with AAA-type ATPase domain